MNACPRSVIALLRDRLPWLGFSIYLAWPFVLYYSPVSLGETLSYIDLSIAIAATTCFFALALVALALCRVKSGRIELGGRPLRLAGLLTSLGILLTVACNALPQAAARPVLLVASLVTGAASAYVAVHYHVLYSQLDGLEISRLFPLCYLLSAVMWLVSLVLPAIVTKIVVVLLPLAPLKSLDAHLAQPKPTRASQEQTVRSLLVPLTKMLISVFVFGVVFGYQRGFMTSGIQDDPAQSGVAYFLAMGAAGLAISLICTSSGKPFATTALYKVASVIMAVSLMCLLYLPDNGNLVASIGVAVAYLLFDLAILLALASHVRRTRRSALAVFSFGLAASHLGMALGIFVGLTVSAADDLPAQASQAITAIVGLLILVAAMFMFSDIDIPLVSSRDPGTAADATSRRADTCDKLATTYNLSPREREVLALLLEGRNLPAIQEILCLSESTVKTHKRHIYEKIGIHSQQELLDRADAIERK